MAKTRTDLIAKRAYGERRALAAEVREQVIGRRNTALRGVVTRLQNKAVLA